MRPKAERRRHPRKRCRLRVRLSGARELREHYISNLGAGGVFVETLYPLRIGSQLELDLVVGEDSVPLRIKGEVVWVRPDQGGKEPGMGVRFLEFEGRSQDRLKELLAKEPPG